MTFFRSWLLGVTACAVLVSIAELLTHGAAMRRAVRFTGGLLLMIAMLRPLLAADLDALGASFLSSYRDAAAQRRQELSGQYEDALASGIAERTQAYIEDKADALGAAVRAEVTTQQTDGVPLPVSVTLYGRKNAALGACIARELGIAEENQQWIEPAEAGG